MKNPLRGPWGSVIGKLKDAKDWLVGPSEEELQRLGVVLVEEIQYRIRANTYSLSDNTIARKEAEGAPAPYHAWTEWMTLLEKGLDDPKVESKSFGKSGLEITFSNKRHAPDGHTYSEVAQFVEFGTINMPARPILFPLADEVRDGTLPAIKDFREALLKKVTLGF